MNWFCMAEKKGRRLEKIKADNFLTDKKGKPWEKEIKADDVLIDDGSPGDLIIPGDYARVGHELQSETQHIQHYQLPSPLHHIVVVDTPGFDNTSNSDREILRRIAVWMAKLYSFHMKVAGVIYLHNITRKRQTGTMVKNFDMFAKLCGPDAAPNVALVTTKGSSDLPEEETDREAGLREMFWKDMLRVGSKMRQFDNTEGSARAIIDEILARKALDATWIQSELVDINKMLTETDAGHTLHYTLKGLLERQKEAAKNLEREGGYEARNVVIDNDVKIREILWQIEALSIPLKRRVLHFFGLLES
ncbi:hypothetical protein DXG01_005353 [Tephrocybe rancida]|nr:hypothetical protein DXG01_005353 [Tephrocybe rancida]